MWQKFNLKKWQSEQTAPNPKSFGILISLVLMYFAIVKFQWNMLVMTLAFLCLLLIFIKPSLYIRPAQYWQNFGFVLGWLTTPVFLAGVYFLLFVPMALLMKMLGHIALPDRGWVKKNRPCRFNRIF
jgi:hypothetical protein